MLNVMICDDDQNASKQLYDLLEHYIAEHDVVEMKLHTCSSGNELLRQIEEGQSYDIYFLAIMMGDMDGIELGRKVRESGDIPEIVYVTSAAEYALDAFEVYAGGYLLKPVTQERLIKCMDHLVRRLSPLPKRTFGIKSRDSITHVDPAEIIWVENAARVMHFHMSDGREYSSVYIRQPFEVQLEELLHDGRFIQPHKSFIINMDHIEKVMPHDFILADGTMIPISRNNTAVKKKYLEFLSRTGQ
jgi:DNA-binding LytR/AlgR family response regulator